MENEKLGFGAFESTPDSRDFKAHEVMAELESPPPEEFRIKFPHPNYNQRQIGICTAIDFADMMELAWGIPFSSQFIYNIGKKLIDGNLNEGSRIRTMLKVLNKYGAAPLSLVPTDDTRKKYTEYVNDWFTPEAFEEALKYKMNYASARIDPVGFAIDLVNSKYGLATRTDVGDNWYTPSWNKSDLELLRAPNPITGGHAVKVVYYKGLDQNQIRENRNTWGGVGNPTRDDGTIWCDDGNIKYKYSTHAPYVTEAWSIIKPFQPTGFIFKKDLRYGMDDPDVRNLQVYLNNHGFPLAQTGIGSAGQETTYFGNRTKLAVIEFQKAKGLPPTGFCGPLTRSKLNNY